MLSQFILLKTNLKKKKQKKRKEKKNNSHKPEQVT